MNFDVICSSGRAFSAALPREEVYKIAREVHAQVWDPKVEEQLKLHFFLEKIIYDSEESKFDVHFC